MRLRARPFVLLALIIVLSIFIRNALAGGPYRVFPAERYLLEGQHVEICGYLKKIEFSKDRSLLFLDDSIVSFDSKEYQAGTIILSTRESADYLLSKSRIEGLIYGSGKWGEFSHASNPGQFDEYGYYKSIGVDGRVSGTIQSEDMSTSSVFKTRLALLRKSFSDSIDNSLLEEDERSILKAMVLGDRSELTPELKELYKNAGIIHLISISGLHITIIGMGLYRLLRRTGRSFSQAGLISALIMTGYVIMTGASVSSLRALISFTVLMGAEITGRSSDVLNTLSLAASVLLLSDGGLLYNSGFWLSFSSVMGISLFMCIPKTRGRREKLLCSLRTGAGLWLFTLPVIISVYCEFPLYSVFVNLIVVSMAPVLLVAGLTGTILGVFIPVAADCFYFAAGLVMRFNTILTNIISALPFSTMVAGKPGMIRIIIYYSGIAALLLLRKISENKLNVKLIDQHDNCRLISLRILTISLMFLSVLFYPRIGTSITFLDVGQGDSILIRCDNGSNIMIDAGSGNVPGVGDRRIIPCLKAYGISMIHRLILTHPDADHINAVDEILHSNIDIGEILIAEVHSKDDAILELRDKVYAHNDYSINKTNIHCIQRNDMFTEGNTAFNVLSPRGKSRADINSVSDPDMDQPGENDRNATSIVIEMVSGDTKVLFTGDMEKSGEDDLTSGGSLEDVDILKVAHHGSKYSSSEAFLEKVKPEIAVISCSKKNRYGHPHRETMDRLNKIGARIYSTPEYGAVEIWFLYKPIFMINRCSTIS